MAYRENTNMPPSILGLYSLRSVKVRECFFKQRTLKKIFLFPLISLHQLGNRKYVVAFFYTQNPKIRREFFSMSKRLDKISKIEGKLAQLEEQRKQEVKKAKEEERKTTNKRHCKRGEVMEKALPDIITISGEQFDIFVKKALATNHTKNVLAELVAKDSHVLIM